jgi:hypothetical protein
MAERQAESTTRSGGGLDERLGLLTVDARPLDCALFAADLVLIRNVLELQTLDRGKGAGSSKPHWFGEESRRLSRL